jgi:hypothetical protein
MRVQSLTALTIVLSILLVMATATEVFVDDHIEPDSAFTYLLVTTLISGTITTILLEKVDARVLS